MKILPDFREEKKLWRLGFQLVIGVDEVGRGAFAGPVVVGAVAFPAALRSAQKFSRSAVGVNKFLKKGQNANSENFVSPRALKNILTLGINDSKLLTPKKRKKLTEEIKKYCLVYGIGEVGVATINKIGIGRATQQAMRKAIAKILGDLDIKILSEKKEKSPSVLVSQYLNIFLLVDGVHVKYLRGIGLKNQKAIIKGDQKSISIAAASILAKVYRDALMRKFTKRYKEYQWGINKGYGTKKHQAAIFERGLTTFHRRQFVETFLKHYAQAL